MQQSNNITNTSLILHLYAQLSIEEKEVVNHQIALQKINVQQKQEELKSKFDWKAFELEVNKQIFDPVQHNISVRKRMAKYK